VSRYLKTGIHNIIGTLRGKYCYIDNDVFAVSPRADEIFKLKNGPVMFAPDAGKTVRSFSKYAVKGVPLKDAIRAKFRVRVRDDWPIWNGGVFLFDLFSKTFLDNWHNFTLKIFEDPSWRDRDQGTLIATIWKRSLQYQRTLPVEFNWLHKLKGGLKHTPGGFRSSRGEIVFLHFPVTYGDPSSKTWNRLVRLLQ
jgi:hypothetical protein